VLAAAILECEHRNETGDLLGDHAPFVDSTGTFEQEPFRIEPDRRLAILGSDTGLDREGSAGPGEQRVDGLLDLAAQFEVELLTGEMPEPYQHRAEPLAWHGRLGGYRLVEGRL